MEVPKPNMEALKPNTSLVQKTYEALLEAICTGAIKAGERLSQDDLAEQLNVSRQPVNSAIAMLKSQRFVQDTGRRGVVVAPVDSKMFESIYQFRSVIEPLAVELATPRLTKEAIVLGRDIIVRGKGFVQRDDSQSTLRADMDFHSLIYQLCGNLIIADTMHLNWRHLQRSMSEVLRSPGMSIRVWKEHERIFEAMVSGDADHAASLMREHIHDATRRISGPVTPDDEKEI